MLRYVMVIGCGLVLCSTALAELAIQDLGDALPGYVGTRLFRAEYEATGTNLDVDVDFAVFAPGDFTGGSQSTPGTFFGYGAVNTGQYVYAYQLHNLESSTVALSNMTLDLVEGSNVTGIGWNSHRGDINATFPDLSTDDYVGFWFIAPQLMVKDDSYFLLFSSPNPPTLAFASILDGGIATEVDGGLPVPTQPVPAPGALALGILGLTGLRRLRRQ